ncbi:MAG: Tad domain-containing protein [Phycisphaerae bacterium]
MTANQTPGTAAGAPTHSPSRRPARRGQVLIVVIVGLTLMVGLIFFVYNLGDQVNRRLEMQNAADSTAVSGGGWMARSMNMIAMNNTGQAKLISLVPVLDALPLSTEMAYTEVDAWQEAIGDQLDDHIPSLNGAGDLIEDGLQNLRERMITQRDILKPFNQMLNESDFDMAEHTFWRLGGGNTPQGNLWKAAVTLAEINEATAESAGVLAQTNAVRYGRQSQAKVAFVVPILPKMPARLGTFEDFQPVLQGRQKVTASEATMDESGGNGGAIPDLEYPHRLGPYARLMRWRDLLRKATAWKWVPGQAGVGKTRGGSSGKVKVGGRKVGGSAKGSSGGGTSGRWAPTDWEVYGYHPYGPFSWAMRRIDWYANDHWHWEGSTRVTREGELPDTFFYRYTRDLARLKLDYMFDYNPQIRTYHYPEWITPYPEARTFATENESKVYQTMFYLVEIASKNPPSSGNWLKPGTYRTNGERPIAVWTRGWQDPGEWSVPKVGNHIWRDEYYYETIEDQEIGIRLKLEPATNEPVWQKVYMTSFWIFGGIDVGEDVDVRNPCNYHSDENLPYPLLLDTTEGDYDPHRLDPDSGIRRELFSYLGITRDTDQPVLWKGKFQGVNPADGMYAVAQAEVFNKSSWDLWTQDWQVRLKPVAKWEDWMERLDRGVMDAPPEVLDVEDVERALEYLDAFDQDVAEWFFSH